MNTTNHNLLTLNFLTMKHLKIVLIALITFGAVNLTQAQTKVAHISTQELLEAMPDYQNAMSQLEKLSNSYKSQIQDMLKELQEKSKKYEAEAAEKSDVVNQGRMEEMQQSQQRIRQFRMNAQEDMSQKREELLKPILEKAKNAIEKVAKEKGYDYVLNASDGYGVIVSNGHDLLPDVKKELGI